MAMLEIVTGKFIELTMKIGIAQLVEISLLIRRHLTVKNGTMNGRGYVLVLSL